MFKFRVYFRQRIKFSWTWNSIVGVTIRYWLDGPGIESLWRRDLPHPSRRAQGSTQPPVHLVLGHSREQSSRGVALTTHRI